MPAPPLAERAWCVSLTARRIVLLIFLLMMLVHWLASLFFLISARPGGWIDIHICRHLDLDAVEHRFFEPIRCEGTMDGAPKEPRASVMCPNATLKEQCMAPDGKSHA